MPTVSSVRWDTGVAPTTDLLQGLAMSITDAGSDAVWKLKYPATIPAITDEMIIEKVSDPIGYIHFRKPDTITVTKRGETEDMMSPGAPFVTGSRQNHYCLEVRILKDVDISGSTISVDEDMDSEWARFSWFMADTPSLVKKWLPVRYWVSVTPNALQIILSGDPNASAYDRLISWSYFGKVVPFKQASPGTDNDYNFGMTVSSDCDPKYSTRYSDKTGTGVTDFVMFGTSTGFPFQAHYLAQTTPYEFVDKALEGPSAYTDKYHMSPLYIFHGFDGYRGELEGVISCDRSSIVHLDDLIVNKDHLESPGEPELIYKAFLINAPYSLMSNGANVMYAVAMLRHIKPA